MIKKLDLKDIEIVKEVLNLQIASYKVEAEIISFYEIPPLKDTIKSLIECDEIFYGYYIDNVLAGIISYKVFENILDIHRVAVYPHFFRRGIAHQLINYIQGLNINIDKIIVCTANKNLPAINLYLKNGYKEIDNIEICKDTYLTKFEKKI
jgi:ribosomal protein S18 acetylase RimI-like enzyme